MWQPPPQRSPHPSPSLRWGKVWSQIVATGKCTVCGKSDRVESVTVRIYSRRSQVDFRYRVCREDKRVMYELLSTGASEIQRGLFNPPTDIATIALRAASL